MFVIIYTGIKLKTNQQAIGIKIIPQHNNHKGANGAIHGVVAHKVPHKQRERHRGEYGKRSGNGGANAPETPLDFRGGAIIINKRCRHIKQNSDEHPVDRIKHVVHGFPAGMVEVNKNVNEVFAQNDEGNGNQQCNHEQYGYLKRYPIPVGKTSSPEVGMVLVKRSHQRAHTACGIIQSKHQTNGQQTPTMTMNNIFNSIMGGIISSIGHYRLNRVQQGGGEPINGYISNHGKQENNTGKGGQQKIESNRCSTNINRIALYLSKEKRDRIVYSHTFKTGHGECMPPFIKSLIYFSCFKCFKPVAQLFYIDKIKLKSCDLFPMQTRFINIYIARFFIFKGDMKGWLVFIDHNGYFIIIIIIIRCISLTLHD